MKFIYNEEIDKKCRKNIDNCKLIFGEEKRTGIFPVNKKILEKFKSIWTPKIEKNFSKKIFQIFETNLPKDFICFLNSTPYSMDIEQGISISASTKNPIKTICHEANHYMFRKSKYKSKYFPKINIEEAKEIFTIINNIYFQDIMESQDIGWKKFWKDRYNFLNIWLKDKNI
ncbi:MAG: hypothetical protein WC839_01460 [Candidatus Paceibacterota bacterium]